MPESSTTRTALITGASVGIGRDLAELFARDAHHLILIARNQSVLNELAEKLRAQFKVRVDVISKDLSIPGAAKEIVDRVNELGLSIDFLVNNAGFGLHGPFVEGDVQGTIGMLEVNVVALTHLCRLVLPAMVARRSGKILNVASTAAFLPGPLMAVYYATKAYVLSFSEALDSELAGSGVTVTALSPGPTLTEFHKRAKIENTALFKANTMDSKVVARIGYDAMMWGKRTVIAGWKNRALIALTKLTPRRILTASAKSMNKDR